jgi:putative transposase
MPRQARLVLPHSPHYILQRGHNRQAVFARNDDYTYYLDTREALKTHYGYRSTRFV